MAKHITKTVAWNDESVYKYKITLDAYFDLVSLVGTTATINVSGNYIISQSEHDQQMVSVPASDYGFLFEGNVIPAPATTAIAGDHYMEALPTLFGGSAEQYYNQMLLEFRGDTYASDGGNFTNLWTKSDGLIINRKFGNTTTTIPLNINIVVDVSGGGTAPVLSWSTTYVTFNPTTYHWGDSVAWVTWVDLNWDATLTYNANSGSGGPGVVTHSTPASDSSYTFTVSSAVPTRSGYEFQGWADSSTATTPTYHSGDTITVTKGSPSKTIYAVWKKIYDYSLTYNANGGSGAPAAQTYSTTDTSHGFTVSSTTPSWGVFIFLGWSDSPVSGSGTPADVDYSAGDTITLTSSSTAKTIYAVWQKDYRPGSVYNGSNDWLSHNRPTGCADIYDGTTWQTMRTIDGGVSSGNPPEIYDGTTWHNMRKIGTE